MEENLKFKYDAPESTVTEVQAEGRVIMSSGLIDYPDVPV